MKTTIRSVVCLLLTLVMLAGMGSGVFADWGSYSDVPETAWFYEPVMALSAEGIIQGVGNGKFAPNDTLTRAMAVTLLYRIAGCPDVSGLENPFTDVKTGSWYDAPVRWAVANGVTNGTSSTSFSPNKPITREQLACFLFRYGRLIHAVITADLDVMLQINPYVEFAAQEMLDQADCSAFAEEAMERMVQLGIYHGDGNSYFRPKSNATRAETAAVLYRFEKLMARYGTYEP